jgi:hypothetical protein
MRGLKSAFKIYIENPDDSILSSCFDAEMNKVLE